MSIEHLSTFNCPVCEVSHTISLSIIKWIACPYCFSSLAVTPQGLVDEGFIPEKPFLASKFELDKQGLIRGKSFTVLGNVVFRNEDESYSQEWFIAFEDGSTIWLEDRGEMTMYAESIDMTDQVPSFESLKIDEIVSVGRYQLEPEKIGMMDVVTYHGQIPKHGIIGDRFYYFDGAFRNYVATVEYTSSGAVNLFFGIALKSDELEIFD